MKSAAKKFSVLLVGAALLAGCSKKPLRPDPSATVMGPQGSGSSSNLNPSDVATNPDAAGLQGRDAFDASGQQRGLLEPVYFDLDRSVIKASERPKLQAAKDYLDKNPQYRLLLEGHCDWRGTAEYNLGLGDRRANEAKKYLASLGVGADKLETLSKGSEDAKKEGGDSVWSKDRRVELVVLKGDAGAASAVSAPAAAH